MKLSLSVALSFAAGTAQALTPLPPCGGVEAGMRTGFPAQIPGTGIVVEEYRHNISTHGDLTEADTPPADALSGFDGLRVTHCASGRFIVVAGQRSSYEAADLLAATVYLREAAGREKPASVSRMKQAVKATFGEGYALRETAETCACNTYFPELRAKGVTPWGQRNDTVQ